MLNNASLGGGIIKGKDAYNLEGGFRFNKIFFPGFGHVSIEHNAALDSEFNRTMDEELIGGLPKFSYTCMMLDLTDNMTTNAFEPSKQVEFAQARRNAPSEPCCRNSAGHSCCRLQYLHRGLL